MLQCGQFDNLKWSTLAEAHAMNWELLQSRFGLSSTPPPPLASLDELASMSIQACSKYLFTDTLNCGLLIGRRTGAETFLKDDLEEYFSTALQDHLVVTFAHRFLCENLQPREQSRCLHAVYDCRTESAHEISKPGKGGKRDQQVRDADAARELRENYTRARRRSCAEYGNKIDTFLALYKELLKAGYEGKAASAGDQYVHGNKPKPPKGVPYLIRLPHIDKTAEINTVLELITQENSARTAERYAAPNWIYSLAMACSWTGSPLAVKNGAFVFARDSEDGSLAYGLAKFLGNQEWGPMLFREAEENSRRLAYLPFTPVESRVQEIATALEDWQLQTLPVVEMRTDESACTFVGVPYIKDTTYRCVLPQQSYTIEGSSRSFELPSEIQQMMNCYLTERTFHGYASMTVLECIREQQSLAMQRNLVAQPSKSMVSELNTEQKRGIRQTLDNIEYQESLYLQLPSAIRLRAPLVHPALIRLLAYAIRQPKLRLSWVEDFITEWNLIALPILEEFFIRLVWTSYRNESIETVLAALTAALMRSEDSCRRCDRLNWYRLVPVKDFPTTPPLELRYAETPNQVMANAYLAGLGFSIDPDNPMLADLGRAMAFDDLTDAD